MPPKYFVGIDISKLSLDIALICDKDLLTQFKIENREKAIVDLFKKLRLEYGCTGKNTAYCAENMGLYGAFLTSACQKKGRIIYLEPPLKIKRSLGIVRGKTDAIDSIRIAQYLSSNFEDLKPWQPPRAIIQELKDLLSIRKQLLKLRRILGGKNSIREHYLSGEQKKIFNQYYASTKAAIQQDIKRVEGQLQSVLRSDTRICHLTQLMKTIPTVGTILATEMIIRTNEFETHLSARKFACYCGIVPFELSSGTSLRGKPKVSIFGNKEMKTLLHLCAISAVHTKGTFFKKYYERKCAEGKHKMSVLNALKNKIVHTIFAIVRDSKPYLERN